ncbi:GTPase Era [Candidatus Bipolaricaulota bacterium]|nr:GTPase Era [Candidatus Bipolaricaulota bacterium]
MPGSPPRVRGDRFRGSCQLIDVLTTAASVAEERAGPVSSWHMAADDRNTQSAEAGGHGGGHPRVGFVGVLGQTNVGKSTFLNAVLGEKLLITSPKPQTTRNRIRCVLTTDTSQIVFLDTPGLHRPANRLGRHILREAYRSLRGLNVLLYMVEPWGGVHEVDREALERIEEFDGPIILLVNKTDIAKRNALEETLLAYEATGRFAELIPISAVQGDGLLDTIETIGRYLPEGEPLFSADVKFDSGEEFLISELIREKAIRLTYRELPYSIAVRVKWFRERDDGLIEIKSELIVERESQKGILVGKGGRMIREIGTRARRDIERLLGARVFLELIVKVVPNWTQSEVGIRQLTDSQ